MNRKKNNDEKIELFENLIGYYKECWLISLKTFDLTKRVVYSDFIETLIELKRDIGLITNSKYVDEIYNFHQWKNVIRNEMMCEIV